jgi:HPt (histidine-containing phosphotransfer) domain-containing protein
LIINFVEKDYEDKKTQIEEALANKDAANLYYIVHTFKTTARMLCIEDFAKECEVIQEYCFKGREDWDKLTILVPQFLKDFQAVYEDANNIYEKDYKPKPAEIMDDPYVNTPYPVNSPETFDKRSDKIDSNRSFNFFNDQRNIKPEIKNDTEPEDIEEIDDKEIVKCGNSGKISKRRSSNFHRDSEMIDKVHDLIESNYIISDFIL